MGGIALEFSCSYGEGGGGGDIPKSCVFFCHFFFLLFCLCPSHPLGWVGSLVCIVVLFSQFLVSFALCDSNGIWLS